MKNAALKADDASLVTSTPRHSSSLRVASLMSTKNTSLEGNFSAVPLS